MHALDRAKRSLDFALARAVGRLPSEPGHMRQDSDAEIGQDILEDAGASNRAVVRPEAASPFRLPRLGVEQQAQRRFGILVVDTAIF